jgi:hypothetical protein
LCRLEGIGRKSPIRAFISIFFMILVFIHFVINDQLKESGIRRLVDHVSLFSPPRFVREFANGFLCSFDLQLLYSFIHLIAPFNNVSFACRFDRSLVNRLKNWLALFSTECFPDLVG